LPGGRRHRRQVENGPAYLRELVFGDPEESNRREGLRLPARLESWIVDLLTDGPASMVARRRCQHVFSPL
jgi:hypothetical protein